MQIDEQDRTRVSLPAAQTRAPVETRKRCYRLAGSEKGLREEKQRKKKSENPGGEKSRQSKQPKQIQSIRDLLASTWLGGGWAGWGRGGDWLPGAFLHGPEEASPTSLPYLTVPYRSPSRPTIPYRPYVNTATRFRHRFDQPRPFFPVVCPQSTF